MWFLFLLNGRSHGPRYADPARTPLICVYPISLVGVNICDVDPHLKEDSLDRELTRKVPVLAVFLPAFTRRDIRTGNGTATGTGERCLKAVCLNKGVSLRREPERYRVGREPGGGVVDPQGRNASQAFFSASTRS